MKKLIILTAVATALGIKNLMPNNKIKQIMFQKNPNHLSFSLHEETGEAEKQLTSTNKEYLLKNDEAVVFWRGGPILSEDWQKIHEDYGFMFGQTKNSKDTFGKKVKGNYKVPFDVYVGTQLQWSGFKIHEYFHKEMIASNVPGFVNPLSQRAVTLKDVEYFKKESNLINTRIQVNKMLIEQAELMFELGKQLKEAGYKKVHYIGHSFGSFLVHEFIKQKGNDAFKYVDSISAIGTRFKATKEQIDNIDGETFPYFIYDEKTKEYTKPLKIKVQNNAITKGLMLSIFEVMSKRDYTISLKNLSDENKLKYEAVWTKFDFRIGSMSKEELSLKDDGIKIKEVSTKELVEYNKNYLSQKDYSKKVKSVPKVSLTDKGINHHDLLLRWYLDNTHSKHTNNSWLTREANIKDSRSYWCSIPTEEKISCSNIKK